MIYFTEAVWCCKTHPPKLIEAEYCKGCKFSEGVDYDKKFVRCELIKD